MRLQNHPAVLKHLERHIVLAKLISGRQPQEFTFDVN